MPVAAAPSARPASTASSGIRGSPSRSPWAAAVKVTSAYRTPSAAWSWANSRAIRRKSAGRRSRSRTAPPCSANAANPANGAGAGGGARPLPAAIPAAVAGRIVLSRWTCRCALGSVRGSRTGAASPPPRDRTTGFARRPSAAVGPDGRATGCGEYGGGVRFLLRPAWLALSVAVIGFVVACFTVLAPWQFGREAERDAQQAAIDASY